MKARTYEGARCAAMFRNSSDGLTPRVQSQWQRARSAGPIMPMRSRPWWRFW
jgi:hypothetical protein